MPIRFFTDDITFKLTQKRRIAAWLNAVIANHSKTTGEINYVFVSDKRILELNRQFLQHDYFTDIITFDDTKAAQLNGEMYISIDTVKRNAEQFNTAFDDELHRVIVHGLLHLCGFDDKTEEEEQAMRKLEDEALILLR